MAIETTLIHLYAEEVISHRTANRRVVCTAATPVSFGTWPTSA